MHGFKEPEGYVHDATGIASIAGLPGNSAVVCVGPPLLASPSRSGFVLFRLPVAVKAQELSSEML